MAVTAALNDTLRASLRAAGAATSAELQRACGVSQASISRALAPLLAAGEVLAVGRGPSRAYVMPRPVAGVGTTGSIPVIRVDEDGGVSEFATLIPTAGGRCWIEEYVEPLTQLHDGLPWFLADMRPQGFLGRSFAHLHQDLRLADNPDHWSDDDTLKALCQVGDDLPGNLIVGAQAFERFNRAAPQPRVAPDAYVKLADASMRGALPGSSAGGEQPKFCAVREDGQPVIVKFSPAGDSPFDRRWDDLLVCEHLALTVLNEGGIPAAPSRVFRDGGRTLLEVERFDRTPRGRIGMVSLMSFDNEYIGQIDNWAATAERIRLRGLLIEEDVAHLRFLEAFGVQIGNTDRHYGNISLVIGPNGSWRLAPAYDVLPMIYAPIAGEIVPRDFEPGRLAPSAETLREWPRARALAARYWERVAGEPMVSGDFRALAERHAVSLRGDAPTTARGAAA
ncbi:type II toxin-antitoxin system HipA family toxin YjjJ [Caenimonas sedimenti]|uniref:Type II toxin-antitoxin system HipA family toxin YjjJ n=1 Tax=Caenimonas sedimenti TaxID=2596921 RepID=A0A562ZYI4_9BURK|nr:type II toxin-antitoxin system HipA family toxin YjjJ [Caenimonas sedimenti]TWO73415.1 type II toxin-antitoxin system HipA family toxin YjjJ [Caenimonas sedimenti]